MGAGLICAVIVGAWGAVLVPMWLVRPEERVTAEELAHRASPNVRVLTRRPRAHRPARGVEPRVQQRPSPRTVDRPRRPVRTEHPRVAAAAVPSRRVAAPRRDAALSRRVVAARRRRRAAVILGALAVLAGGYVYLSSAPVWVLLVPCLGLGVFVVRARAAAAQPYARGRAHASRRSPARRAGATQLAGQRAAIRAAAEASAGVRAVRETAPTRAELAADQPGRIRPDGTWQPARVPLPTYVNAAVANRPGRSIDLGTPGAWTAARLSLSPVKGERDKPYTRRRDQASGGDRRVG